MGCSLEAAAAALLLPDDLDFLQMFARWPKMEQFLHLMFMIFGNVHFPLVQVFFLPHLMHLPALFALLLLVREDVAATAVADPDVVDDGSVAEVCAS